MTWDYWIFCTVFSVIMGFIIVSIIERLNYNFAFGLFFLAISIGTPLYYIPIAKDEKKVNESYVLDISYTKDNYVKVSNGEDVKYINFIKNGEDETLEISKDCKIRYKIGKQNKISYKRNKKRNIFGTIYYDEISDVVITKEK